MEKNLNSKEYNMKQKFHKKYLKYKFKYIELKKNQNNMHMSGGADDIVLKEASEDIIFTDDNIDSDDNLVKEAANVASEDTTVASKANSKSNVLTETRFDQVPGQITQLNKFIEQITNSIKKTGEKNPELISLTTQLEKYLVDQDIPIDLKFNPYMLSELESSLNQLKLIGTRENLTKLYEQRNHIYSMDESNYYKVLDWIIEKNSISSIKDVEKLFSSLILGTNKNYVVYYMVLLRFLITRKTQLSVLENYSSILSWYGLKSCLANGINSDDYLPLILKLIIEYIGSFPIKKALEIKKPSDFESEWKAKQKLLELEMQEIPNARMVKFDTKNKIFQYESGEIKEISKMDWEDLVKILFNLFRIYIPKIKPEFQDKNISGEKSPIV